MSKQVALKTNELTIRFGGVVAVSDLNLTVNRGEIVGIIGPNGAGKTTAFNIITGVYAPTQGNVEYYNAKGEKTDITGKRPDQIALSGIARTFQNIRLFSKMTVLENVLLANHLHVKSGVFTSMLWLPKYRREERAMVEKAMHLLELVGLEKEVNSMATSLPYGLQRRLEIARALATDPDLLLLDEPAAGMNPHETFMLSEFVKSIRETFDLTILLIEHHMQIVMDICDKIYVLEFGKTIAADKPSEIQKNPAVIKAYLGVPDNNVKN